ncbi:MAG: SIMPL domain-containing protein, partial [Planctomycetes bacterium]|nr:SIMPL domain-containing protein [Planctomycetota bacterium]
MMSTSMRWGVAVLAGLMLPVLAAGQESERVVSAQGTASVEKMPEIVRLKIDIPAVGSDVKEALAKLKAKREGAVKKLKELGAADGAIRVDGPRLAPDPTEMMRRQRVMMRGRIPQEEESEEEKRPSKVNVALTLHAEWPVKTEDSESLLVFAHELQEKVKKADLAALKEEKLTEEEEEELAQMAEDMPRFDSDEVPPGEAVIVYVARIGDEERAKL